MQASSFGGSTPAVAGLDVGCPFAGVDAFGDIQRFEAVLVFAAQGVGGDERNRSPWVGIAGTNKR